MKEIVKVTRDVYGSSNTKEIRVVQYTLNSIFCIIDNKLK